MSIDHSSEQLVSATFVRISGLIVGKYALGIEI